MKPVFLFCLAALGALHIPLVSAEESAALFQATPVDKLRVAKGFKVELLYSVPKEQQGSWVAMCVDNKGRLIVSDQYGALYRLTPPPAGTMLKPEEVEKIDLDIGGSQGMLYAFDSLYVVTNTKEHGGRGLYRVRDTDGDDKFDKVEQLKKFEEQGGEHGPHAIIAGPDGKSLYVICGNQTALPEYNASRVPESWGEDNLLPRIYGRGFMTGSMAPRGWIAKTDPEGKNWEIQATGFRNEYDAAFNEDGELFSYDADMEWDVGQPWYRPTRVCHVISGVEFGWRNGSAKWPEYYLDSFGPVVNVGPGSPTGVGFGYGTKFPERYQKSLFICDWSYGKLYTVHLKAKGASYEAELEEFVAGQPLPLTDVVVRPQDGALYFSIGGRRVQAGLYRVTWVGGSEAGPLVAEDPAAASARALRHELEAFHVGTHPSAVTKSWPHLSSADRAIRYAARVAIEHQPVTEWKQRALEEKDPQAAFAALTALARHADHASQAVVVDRLLSFDPGLLPRLQRLDLLRATGLAFLRLGDPTPEQKQAVAAQWLKFYPAPSAEENIELSRLFGYLGTPESVAKTVGMLVNAPSQEEQIAYALHLRLMKEGWTRELRTLYFEWFTRAAAYKGGANFAQMIGEIKTDALASTPEEEKKALAGVINAVPKTDAPQFSAEPRSFVKAWVLKDFDDVINVGLEGGRNYANGRKMFGAGMCFGCHRFQLEGGAIGPDLTSVAGKFSPHDLLESIIDPSKEISDQYGAMVFTRNDGSQVVGRVMNMNGDSVQVNTDMLAPGDTVNIDRKDLKDISPSTVSMMPPGMLYTMTKDDVLDLLAYLLSKGNPDDPIFK
ncbi:MAG: c-type cytochrome [Verrucomicrobiales bacterium]|nr:c-type cytochrome [Verrucomicrobiales bacterium]